MNTAHQAMAYKNSKRKSKKYITIAVVKNVLIYKTLPTNQCYYKNYINSLTYRNENDLFLMLLSIALRKNFTGDHKKLLQNDIKILSNLGSTNLSSHITLGGNIFNVKDGPILCLIVTFVELSSANNFIIQCCPRRKKKLNKKLNHLSMLGGRYGKSIRSSICQFNIISSIKDMVFEKYIEAEIALHSVFRFWFILNVTQGFMLNEILRKFNIHAFYIRNKNGFALIKKIHRFSLNFIDTLPTYITMMDMTLLDLHKNINFPILFDAKSLHFNVCAIIMDNKSYTFDNNQKQNYCNNSYSKKDCFTQCNENKGLFIDFGTNTEDIFEREGSFSIDFYNLFQNSKLWMPNLCGASSYMLKYICLNESFLNLDEVEEFTWEMADLFASSIFYKTFFTDLCKCVGSIFFSSPL